MRMSTVAEERREHTVLVDARGSRASSRAADRTTWRLVVGSLLTLVFMVVAGFVVGARLAEKQALVDARRFTSLLATTFVPPDTAQALLDHDMKAGDALEEIVRDRLARETSVHRIKVWSPQGEVLYSNDRAEIGKRYPVSELKRKALVSNGPVEKVSDLSDSESRRERPLGSPLIEVYDPVPAAGGGRVLFEAYLSYNRIREQREAVVGTLAWLAVVGFVVLAAVQLTIGLANVRWMRRRQRALDEHARASAERDRRLLARNLHDGPIQDLVGTGYVVDGARSAIRAGRFDEADNLLATASASVRHSVQGLRAGIVELHPRSLHQVGLAQALDDLAQPLRTRGISVTIDLLPSRELDRHLDGALVEVAYRCVQELLRNILQHADARHVQVIVECCPETLCLSVSDDGRGLQVEADTEQGHLGLQALTDIATELRGSLEVWSAPGAGTEVRMELSR